MSTWTAETPEGTITWTNGKLTGADRAVGSLTVALPGFGTIAVTPTGPFLRRHVIDPMAVLTALDELYPGHVKLAGDVPEVDYEIPDGAVA